MRHGLLSQQFLLSGSNYAQAMSSETGTANLLRTPESKSQMKTECNSGERDMFREIPLRYAGECNNYSDIALFIRMLLLTIMTLEHYYLCRLCK